MHFIIFSWEHLKQLVQFHMMYCLQHCCVSLATLSSSTISLTISQPGTNKQKQTNKNNTFGLAWHGEETKFYSLRSLTCSHISVPYHAWGTEDNGGRGHEAWGGWCEGMCKGMPCHKRVSDGHIGVGGQPRWNSRIWRLQWGGLHHCQAHSLLPC